MRSSSLRNSARKRCYESAGHARGARARWLQRKQRKDDQDQTDNTQRNEHEAPSATRCFSNADVNELLVLSPSAAVKPTFAAKAKGNKSHTIPLGNLAASVLTWDERPTTYQGKMKAELDRLLQCSKYVTHDFRRYVALTMASLGIALPTIEYVLGQRSGSFAGIVQVYQRYNWAAETKEAIRLYEKHLIKLLATGA